MDKGDTLNEGFNDTDNAYLSKKMTEFTVINTNSRSLCPKIDSLVDCMTELEAGVAIVTETWFREGPELEALREKLMEEDNIGIITENRKAEAINGVTYGGVALLWRQAEGSFKKIAISNPDSFEIVAGAGSVRGFSRKVMAVGCYLPPNYTRAKGNQALEFITNTLVDIKRRYSDPFIILAGDFNQWRVEDAVADFPDL